MKGHSEARFVGEESKCEILHFVQDDTQMKGHSERSEESQDTGKPFTLKRKAKTDPSLRSG